MLQLEKLLHLNDKQLGTKQKISQNKPTLLGDGDSNIVLLSIRFSRKILHEEENANEVTSKDKKGSWRADGILTKGSVGVFWLETY